MVAESQTKKALLSENEMIVLDRAAEKVKSASGTFFPREKARDLVEFSDMDGDQFEFVANRFRAGIEEDHEKPI